MTGRTRTAQAAAPRGIRSHLPEFRSALEQQRQFRVDQIRELAVESAGATTAADEPRIQVAAAVRTAAQAALAGIDAALHRLECGSYGTCEQCETAIPLATRHGDPSARNNNAPGDCHAAAPPRTMAERIRNGRARANHDRNE